MHLSPERMPTFMNSQAQSDDTQVSGILHLDPSRSDFDLAREKANGQVTYTARGNPPPQSRRHNKPNDSYDEDDDDSSSITHSAHSSSSSDRRRQVNGVSRTNTSPSMSTSMTSPANGVNGGGVNGIGSHVHGENGKQALPNGIATTPPPTTTTTTTTLVDRTASHPHLQPSQLQIQTQQQNHLKQQQSPLTNGSRDGEPLERTSKDGVPRSSVSSGAAGSIQQSPVEMYIKQVNKGDVTTVDSSNNGGSGLTTIPSNGTVPGGFSATSQSTQGGGGPSTPSPDANAQQQRQSPHRFSSPPAYHSAGATPTSTVPGALHPPSAGLKHRHTLEVPKLAPPRGSRDGMDSAVTSGRFSPTMASTPLGGRRASLSLVRRTTRSLHSEVPRDEILPDEDALRWAEAYRQKRASKRKRREEEDDDRVLVGTKVDEKHANWVTAYNMLTGIRVSVSRTNAKLDRQLTDADFEAKQKSTFDIAGNELVPSAKYDFKFKDYAPWVFRHLRALFRLDPADYLMSLTGKYILSELGSPGKSGSFFYFSRDYKYIIKTIHHAEHKFLRKILKDYYTHVTDNPNTLLSQFYGLHRVKTPFGRKIHFVVMNNLFPPHRDIHMTFDLKGSTIGRDYREDNLEKNPRATLKDLNWLRRQRHLELGLQKKRLFLEQLHKDVRLLQRLQIMDYSLLIGIHDLQKGNEENLRAKTLQVFNPGGEVSDEFDPHSVLMRTPSKLENQRRARELRQMIKAERPIPMGQSSRGMPDELGDEKKSDLIFYKDDGGLRATHEDNTPGEEIYYLGVIDCLTHYGIIKKIEHFWKGLYGDRTQISALPPHQYGERFINFIEGVTMSHEEAAREALEKERAAAEAAAAGMSDAEAQRVGSWGRRKSTTAYIPPAPTHLPPPPPGSLTSGARSPEAEETIRRAELQAEKHGGREEDVPERILRTTPTATGAILPAAAAATATSSNGLGAALKHGPPEWERRESTNPPILPVVEEAAEASSTGGRSGSRISHNSQFSSRTTDSDARPLTPAKDGEEYSPGFGTGILSTHGSGKSSNSKAAPPTPPKTAYGTGYLKPESADSGVGVSGAGNRARSGSQASKASSTASARMRSQISRESLDKALPPLPKLDRAA